MAVRIHIIRNASDSRALVTSSLASSLRIDFAAASFTARWQLKRGGVDSSHISMSRNIGVPAVVIKTSALMNKAIGDVIQAPFSTVQALMIPEGARSVGILYVVASV